MQGGREEAEFPNVRAVSFSLLISVTGVLLWLSLVPAPGLLFNVFMIPFLVFWARRKKSDRRSVAIAKCAGAGVVATLIGVGMLGMLHRSGVYPYVLGTSADKRIDQAIYGAAGSLTICTVILLVAGGVALLHRPSNDRYLR